MQMHMELTRGTDDKQVERGSLVDYCVETFKNAGDIEFMQAKESTNNRH